jgi:hypothetical protein
MTTASAPAKRPTPTDRLMEAQQQIADAKVRDAASSVHLRYARWAAVLAVALLVIGSVVLYFKPSTVVQTDLSDARTAIIAERVAIETVARMPTPQPGLTQQQLKQELEAAVKESRDAFATLTGQVGKFAELDTRIANLVSAKQAEQSAQLQQKIDNLAVMLEGLPAKLAPQKGSEQKEPAPAADKQPPAPANASGNPVQNSAAPQQPAAEHQEFSAKDAAKACADLNVKFQKPFEQMSQADLKAAFEQCEAAEKAATSKRWRRASKEDCPDRFDESAGACRKKMN